MRGKTINIWKVGAWPGIWGDNQESRKKFASKYAIPYDFIAIGSGYLPYVKGWTFKKIKEEIKKNKPRKTPNQVNIRANTVNYFANVMKIEDIFLLYVSNQEVYIGEIKSDYYHVEKKSKLDFIEGTTGDNYAPHRRNVSWKYKDGNEAKRFSNIRFYSDDSKGAVYKIKENDISKIANTKVKEYLQIILKLPYLENE